MLTAAQRARLTVVLVGARNPSNIGAAARALQDFGFTDLRVVNEYTAPFEAAQLEAVPLQAKSAVGAGDVMRQARLFATLPEAIADCTLTIGTTAIGDREVRRPVDPLPQTAATMLAHLHASARTDRLALLFGSEKTGLTNEQLSHCALLTTIPMFAPAGARHLSMNLGQSVAVCLYELTRAGFEGSREIPLLAEPAPTHADRERLTDAVLAVMGATGYTRRFPANAREPIVRRLVAQLGTTHLEATAWMAFFKRVLRSTNPDAD